MFDRTKRRFIQWMMKTHYMKLRPPMRDEKIPACAIALENHDHHTRAKSLVAAMTIEEKLSYITGIHSFCIRAIDRLGLPQIWMSDATSGVRGVATPVTTFPAAVALAASWNRTLIARLAEAIAHECRAAGISILLGPGVNLARIPTCGRNFEYMGEDPFLAGETASAYIAAMQANGVLPTIKHYACNNSEYDRHKTNAVVDERTLHELYLEPFRRAVEHGALGLMTSYNQINGQYGSEHTYLIGKILRGEWQFDGMIVSDWNSLYDTGRPAVCGVDIEMPAERWLSPERLKPLLGSKLVQESDIDEKIIHILSTCSRLGILDRPVTDTKAPSRTDRHASIALEAALEGAVLLKNDENILPLVPSEVKSIVIIGRNAKELPSGGGGSSFILNNLPNGSLAEALREYVPAQASIKILKPRWYRSETDRAKVRSADAVIVCTGYDHIDESESYERSWFFPTNEVRTIKTAASLNKRTIVAISSGGAFETESWIDEVQAVLVSFYLGEKSPQALAQLLTGKSNFSGKLPFTIARRFEDYASVRHYPRDYAKTSYARIMGGQGDPKTRSVCDDRYDEQLNIGYRQFDKEHVSVRFPFGHGLSYTGFSYRDLFAQWNSDQSLLTVSCRIENNGPCAGSEIAQLYISQKQKTVDRPEQELKGFVKVPLAQSESKRIEFTLTTRDFAYYDVEGHKWKTDAGYYEIRIGSSSRDIRLYDSILVPSS